ncbi:hypothetical protein BV22DRAFT_983723, partial [Leucogyrophana mollusca]
LTETNYSTWEGEMKAHLCTKGWLLSGKEKRSSSGDDKQATWDAKADKAAGELYLGLSPEQRIHIDAV